MTALFFDKRYDLARVGRYKFNYKLGIGARLEGKTAAETVVDPRTGGYLKFLTMGGSDYPIEELKVAGVDLTKPETIKSAMKVFEDSIDELAQLIDEI